MGEQDRDSFGCVSMSEERRLRFQLAGRTKEELLAFGQRRPQYATLVEDIIKKGHYHRVQA